MANHRQRDLLHHIRKIALGRDGGGLTDARLVGCYVQHGDDAAFSALVRRHGLLVWEVCMRVLRDHHDAEDAFQATFMVLARKARSLRSPEMLANWLYGVANRSALKAKAARARRQRRERQVTEMPQSLSTDRETSSDLASILDRELCRLPDKYRVAIVLCDLEGKSRQAAARELGIPEGTVASRLARARDLLAKRLTRRGVTLSASGLAATLTVKASACVPDAVISTTIKAATLLAAGQAAGAVSAPVVALTEGVLRAMFIGKIVRITAVVLVLGATACGTGLVTYQMAAGPAQDGAGLRKNEGGSKKIERPLEVAQAGALPQNPKDDPKRKADSDAKIDMLIAEIGKLREELNAATKEIKGLKEGQRTAEKRQEQTYKGKPLDYWMEKFRDADPEFRTEAVYALGMLAKKNQDLIPVLTGALKDEDEAVGNITGGLVRGGIWGVPTVGKVAAQALVDLGPAAVPALMEVMKDKTSKTGLLNAVNAIRGIGPTAKAAAPLLAEALKDNDLVVRYAAFSALLEFGPAAKGAVTALSDLLKNDDWQIRGDAIEVLGRIGSASKPAIPAIIECLGVATRDNLAFGEKLRKGQAAEQAPENEKSRSLNFIGLALLQIDPQLEEIIPPDIGNTMLTFEEWQAIHKALKKKHQKQK